jgi:hypothetical protein
VGEEALCRLPKWFAEQRIGGRVEPRAAGEGGCTRITQREGSRAVGEHGSLAVWFNHHHDAGAATTALQERFDTSAHQGRLKGFGGGVVTDCTNEARGAPSGHGRHRDIGGTAATPSRDLSGRIGASPPWRVEPHGDLVD